MKFYFLNTDSGEEWTVHSSEIDSAIDESADIGVYLWWIKGYLSTSGAALTSIELDKVTDVRVEGLEVKA